MFWQNRTSTLVQTASLSVQEDSVQTESLLVQTASIQKAPSTALAAFAARP